MDIYSYQKPEKESVIRSVILPMENEDNPNKISKSVWHSIFCRELLLNQQIVFPDRSFFFEEDTLFTLQALLTSSVVAYCPCALYVWDKHLDSESNRVPQFLPQRQMAMIDQIGCLLKENGAWKKYRNELYVLTSRWLRVYYPFYQGLDGNEWNVLCDLLRRIHFPLVGRYDLRLISKKRLKLFFFVLKAKLSK